VLRDAIAAEDWPRALVLAIEAWRTSRSPVHANLVDRIALRAPNEIVPARGVQRWWMQRARTYDPIAAGALLANAAQLAPRSGIEQKLIERLELLAAWPDDPRTAHVLATWFVETNIGWMYAHHAATSAFYERIAGLLVKLRDTRVIAALEGVLAEPRGKTLGLRELQERLATHTIEVLSAAVLDVVPLQGAAEIARWVPAPSVEPATLDERTLWEAAAESEAGRLVLADFLLERGDRRGEVITLACAGDDENLKRSNALLHEQWERWMGELALVLDRGFCTFAGGVLDVAAVGRTGAPPWAYPKVAMHRELTTIRAVRPAWHARDEDYVRFLDALPRLPPRVRLQATAIEKLSLARPYWPVRVLELVTNLEELPGPLANALALAASLMPDVEEIEIPLPSEIDQRVIAAARELPRLFPQLRRVRIDATRHLPRDIRDALVTLAAAAPYLEVEHGHYDVPG
jgi:hypothetical protein